MTPYEAAEALLECVTDAFTAEGVELPKRRYVSDGSVVYDFDETLAVEWEANEPNAGTEAAPGSPADMSSGNLAVRTVFTIHCTREGLWPDEHTAPPTPAKLQANALKIHTDAALILSSILARLADSSLFGVCGDVWFLGQYAVLGDGGVSGSHTRLSVALA